jgi:hypothetical protein
VIEKVIFEAIHFMRSDPTKTSLFKTLKHNNDLCPKYLGKIALILESFEKYQITGYDIQGPRDQGVDIVIKMPSGEEKTKHICIQIKSEDDLKSSYYLKDMKAQHHDAERKYDEILDYYLLLCCDATLNRDKIRNISADFSKDKNVHVVVPEYALTLYRLGTIQINGLIEALLAEEDIVIRKAWDILSALTPTEAAIVVFVISELTFKKEKEVNFDELLSSPFIVEVYKNTLDVDRDWFSLTKMIQSK